MLEVTKKLLVVDHGGRIVFYACAGYVGHGVCWSSA